MEPRLIPASGLLDPSARDQRAKGGGQQEVFTDFPVDDQVYLGREIFVANQDDARIADAWLEAGRA